MKSLEKLKIEKIDHIGGIQGTIGLIRIVVNGVEFETKWMDEPEAINKFNELSGENRKLL